MKKSLKAFLISDYGSVLILLLLCAYYSYETLGPYHPVTGGAGRRLAREIIRQQGDEARVLIVTRPTDRDLRFAQSIGKELGRAGAAVLDSVAGEPADAAEALQRIGKSGGRVTAIATNRSCSQWGPLREGKLAALQQDYPQLKDIRVYQPSSYLWPSFLTFENIRNIVNQNADIAIIAIGMTMVIITAGIDLSVGSLVALCSVVTAMAIQRWGGGAEASVAALVLCSLLGIGLCGLCGAFSGVMVTAFRVPAFIVTLSMMMIARGLALKINAAYQKILTGAEGTPETLTVEAEAFSWLGNGSLLGIPNPILLMLLLFVVAHVIMSRTSVGRYIYAVGGNEEAARLSGVPVMSTLILVYAICGAMAGLGGIVDASRFSGGRPNAGMLYELRVIAAVVVGGTSIAGGEGRVFGTLIGAMIIAVIQNGLNMSGVKPYEQQIVFGILILAAVLLDQFKKRTWR